MSAEEPPNPDNPIEYWLEHQELTRSPTTVDNSKSAVNHLREYLDQRGLSPSEMTATESIRFIKWLRNKPTLADSSAKNYVSSLNEFYSYFSDKGTFETNPISEALREVDFNLDSATHRRDISIEEMAEFLQSIQHPLHLVICTLLAKTGIRAGELSNTDLRDLNLSHPRLNEYLPEPRPEIRNRPNSLFIDSSVRAGEVYNGEEREDGNKRERDTIIPIDEETKQVIIYWLAIRLPDRSDPHPLIQVKGGGGGKVHGARASRNVIGNYIREETKPHGWWDEDAGLEWNVTPHYFRHWFTTQARRRLGDTTVKYIRGDVGGEEIDRYTHSWGDKVEKEYRENIFKLFE